MDVSPLEISFEHPDQVSPVVDLVGRELFEPPSSGVREEKQELPDDGSIVPSGASQLACQSKVYQPQFWLGFTVILGDVGRGRNGLGSGVLRITRLKTRGLGGSGAIRSLSLS